MPRPGSRKSRWGASIFLVTGGGGGIRQVVRARSYLAKHFFSHRSSGNPDSYMIRSGEIERVLRDSVEPLKLHPIEGLTFVQIIENR